MRFVRSVLSWFARLVARGALVVLVALLIGWLWLLGSSAPSLSVPIPEQQVGENPLDIIAMGDSFMSGEGASAFYEGTDTPRKNMCRRAPTAYPVLVAAELPSRLAAVGVNYSHSHLAFVACSGAQTFNLGDAFDFTALKSGYTRPPLNALPQTTNEPLQIAELRRNPDPDVVLLSIGGNDAAFSNVVGMCAGTKESCIPMGQRWLEHLDKTVQPQLRALFHQVAQITSRRTMVFAMTYPYPIAAEECPEIGIDRSEARFLKETFIPRLNQEIADAALMTGLSLIDLRTAFGDAGLCGPSKPTAMRGFHRQRASSLLASPLVLFRGSMHPTEEGHRLMAQAVLQQIADYVVEARRPPGPEDICRNTELACGFAFADDFRLARRPPSLERPPSLVCPPDSTGNCLPPSPPPFEAYQFGPPTGPFRMDANRCTEDAAVRETRDPSEKMNEVTGAIPKSLICYRTYMGDWHTVTAQADGKAIVPFSGKPVGGIGGWRDVLYQTTDRGWVWRIIRAEPGEEPANLGLVEAWLGLNRLSAVAAALGLLVGVYSVRIGLQASWRRWRFRR